MNFIQELKWRGLLHQTAGDNITDYINQAPRVAYCGFDPTADSLTVGNFLAIKLLMHWQRTGHKPIVLMGGATGLIGDPSGKDSERQLMSQEQITHNISQQRKIFERLLDFSADNNNAATIVNNYDWLSGISWIQALRDIGKHFSVNQMIQRDSVKDRLNNREQGISYTEFSYMLLQAYDFLHLFREHNCTLQLAGSDQYGNIVSGMDLIRRYTHSEDTQAQAFGITGKLVTRSDGTKIGKSEGNAIWLSEDKTSGYKFYQFWLNTEDADVIKFLRWFTFLEQEEINAIEIEQNEAPHLRIAQKKLAVVMTTLIHGESTAERAIAASNALFGGTDLRTLDKTTLEEVFADVPRAEFTKDELESSNISQVLVKIGLAESNARAREFLKNNAISINGEKVGPDYALSAQDLLHGTTILFRRGKKNWGMAAFK